MLAGFSEETVVVGSRAQPRTVTASPVPVDVLSTAELTSQGAVNLQDQLRTVIPSFSVNMQPISRRVDGRPSRRCSATWLPTTRWSW